MDNRRAPGTEAMVGEESSPMFCMEVCANDFIEDETGARLICRRDTYCTAISDYDVSPEQV